MSPTDVSASASYAPAFLITIDTEGDNLWNGPSHITTRNADYLPRFQALCEKYGFKPTYLTNYEMATCKRFVAFAKQALARGTAEIGMHLHAWNSPPEKFITGNDYHCAPYLIEYPHTQIREKIVYMTRLLEDTFGVKMTSHRAGRWAFNEFYAQQLVEQGYTVDCSVTPHVSWRAFPGARKHTGSDYRHFPETEYFVDLKNISRAGNSPLLELPMTILPRYLPMTRMLPGMLFKSAYIQKAVNLLMPNDWLRPRRGNLQRMLEVVERARKEGRTYIEFMTHSSEFMPGGSPYFETEEDIEALFRDLDVLFAAIAKDFTGMTLTEYRNRVPLNLRGAAAATSPLPPADGGTRSAQKA